MLSTAKALMVDLEITVICIVAHDSRKILAAIFRVFDPLHPVAHGGCFEWF